MTNKARFEVARTSDGWHARYINPHIGTWTAETRNAHRKALIDIYAITGSTPRTASGFTGWGMQVQHATGLLEVRDVDERQPRTQDTA